MFFISRLFVATFWFILFLAIFLNSACSHASSIFNTKRDVVTLTKENSVTLYGEITDDSIEPVLNELSKLNDTLPRGMPIYLVLDTPGGVIRAGLRIVLLSRMFQREIKTISLDASSTGFIIVQFLGERLVTPNGKLYSHEATIFPCPGQIRKHVIPELIEVANWITAYETIIADRMKISLEKYQELLINDIDVVGNKAVKINAADKVVDAKCSKELFDSRIERTIYLGRGRYQKAIFSGCPLLRKPIKHVGDIYRDIPSSKMKSCPERGFNYLAY